MKVPRSFTDKGIAIVNVMKVLVGLFQKLAQVEGAKSSSRPAEREISPMRFFFVSFFLCASMVKEKSD